MSDEREGETCATCRWWHTIQRETTGECRRYAPRPVASAQISDGFSKGAIFLHTYPDDFCGEHQPKDTPCKSQ